MSKSGGYQFRCSRTLFIDRIFVGAAGVSGHNRFRGYGFVGVAGKGESKVNGGNPRPAEVHGTFDIEFETDVLFFYAGPWARGSKRSRTYTEIRKLLCAPAKKA